MANKNFKESILELLSSTGYGLSLKTDHLSSFENQKNLKPFLDWFLLNVSVENCISNEELEEFEFLEQNSEILYSEEDLSDALKVFHDPSEDSYIPYLESSNEALIDELNHIKDQLNVKTKLLSTIRTSTSAVTKDISEINSEIKSAESRTKEVLKDLFTVINTLNNSVRDAKVVLDELHERLSELADSNEEKGLSIDEGIDTFTSDKLNSSIFSTISVQSTSLYKDSNAKFLCQLPFLQFDKQQKQFARVFEKICLKKADKSEDSSVDLDLELELMKRMDRLNIQKKHSITNMVELEAINSAQEKVKQINYYVQNMSSEKIWTTLRKELMDLEERKTNLNDSFIREDGLSELCKKWAELQIYSSICNVMEEKMDHSNQLSVQLDEIKGQLKKKVAADLLLCEILHWEDEKIEACIQTYARVQTMISQMVEPTKRRLEVMAANAQDYDNYRSLPIESRCDFIGCLAAMLESEANGLKQAINSLDENSRIQHESFLEHYKKCMQTIISVEHKMKDCYYRDVQEQIKPQNEANLELYQSIQSTLDEISIEIFNALLRCQSIEDSGSVPVEDNELQDILKKLVLYYNNKTN